MIKVVVSMEKKMVFLAVVIIQSIYAGYFLLTKLAFDVGMNTFVFVFYRQAAATLFLAPIAILQRKTAPRLSLSIFLKILMLSVFGITMSLDVVGVALKYTSASLGAATVNSLPVITFFLALLLRMEKVNMKRKAGMMKIGGVCVCMGGVATIALYRGPIFRVIQHHHWHYLSSHSSSTTKNNWVEGVFLMLLSNISWALWLLLQGRVLKSYPSKLQLTTLECLLSTVASFITAIAFARNPNQWKLGWNLRLLSVAYCGIMVTGVTFYMQTWVIEKKGPVFLAMTTPLITLITTIISAFILGETISLGSVLGAILLVGGLYGVLWGKTLEECQCHADDIEKDCQQSTTISQKPSHLSNQDCTT